MSSGGRDMRGEEEDIREGGIEEVVMVFKVEAPHLEL